MPTEMGDIFLLHLNKLVSLEAQIEVGFISKVIH